MLVTINTDASFNPHTKEAGYAFWISSDNGRYRGYGKFKEKCSTSQEAEIKSVVNGLHFCRNHPKLRDATNIVVNTDCKTIVDIIKNPKSLKKKYAQKEMRRLRGEIHKYIGKYKGKKADYDFRHVEAHKEIKDSRTWVNDWLDTHAKKAININSK